MKHNNGQIYKMCLDAQWSVGAHWKKKTIAGDKKSFHKQPRKHNLATKLVTHLYDKLNLGNVHLAVLVLIGAEAIKVGLTNGGRHFLFLVTGGK